MPGTGQGRGRKSATPAEAERVQSLIDAAISQTAAQGTRSVSMAAVARRMGTSIRPVRNRVRDSRHLLAEVWLRRLGPTLIRSTRQVVEALTEQRFDLLLSAYRASLRLNAPRLAAAELLLSARFDPLLGVQVDETLGAEIRRWTTPGPALSPTVAARNAFGLALGFGLMIGARHTRARRLDLETALPTWFEAMSKPGTPTPLPHRTADFIDQNPVLAQADPALDILLNTTLRLVSERGFDHVSVVEIAEAAGYTEGLVFSRYPTKLAMVMDAIQRQNEAGFQLNHDFTTALQHDFGPAMAEAVLLREAQRPGRHLGRSMALEQIRIGWHHRELAVRQQQVLDDFRTQLLSTPGWSEYESETDFFLQVCLSWGAYLLPLLNPQIHEVPYDVVYTPLYAAFAQRQSEA